MLAELKRVIKNEYYDQHFHGIDLDERFTAAAARIKQMDENWQILRVIAQVLLDFNDSHTQFYPPTTASIVEYGFSLHMIGSSCFVVYVKKGSDAEIKRLKVGDVVLRIGKVTPTRESLWKIKYLLYQLDPQKSVDVELLNPDGGRRAIVINSRVRKTEEVRKERRKRRVERNATPFKCQEVVADLIACKLYTFAIQTDEIDKMMKAVGKHDKLILDLRGNEGGYFDTLKHLIGYFSDHDVKVGTEVGRGKPKEVFAKTLKKKIFNGQLIVLIDSKSASGSEVFARVMQLEKRGNIVGDASAGMVMVSYQYLLNTGREWNDGLRFYVSVTYKDLIMSDGKTLEGIGVKPDAPLVPSGHALFEREDPILSLAALVFGAKLSPKEAGSFLFLTFATEHDDPATGDEEDEDK